MWIVLYKQGDQWLVVTETGRIKAFSTYDAAERIQEGLSIITETKIVRL